MNIVSYEPATETLYIDRRQFDVLHLRSSSKPKVLASIQIAMQELHGKAVPAGAREVYRDTTIAIVPRMNLRDAAPESIVIFPVDHTVTARREKPTGPMIYTVTKGCNAFPPLHWWRPMALCLSAGLVITAVIMLLETSLPR